VISLGLVGPGVLGRTLALSLPAELYPLGPVLSHSKVSGRRAVREMKRGHAVTSWSELDAVETILIAAPQNRLESVLAAALGELPNPQGKRLLIAGSAGVDARREIQRLEDAGAQVGGLLPIAVYRRPSIVAANTTFAVWGSPSALRDARALVKALRGRHAVIDPAQDEQVVLGVTLVCGTVTTSLELAVRRLVRAGFPRTRAIEALSPLLEICIAEHRRSRQGPPAPRPPLEPCELLRLAETAEPLEAALSRTGLHLASKDLR
jgi:hypothetical protein